MKNTLTLLAALPPTPLAELLFWLILLCGGKLPAVVAEQPAQGLLSVASYPSIQAALDANPGRMVYVPAGDHLISEKIRIHDDNGGLCGPGRVIQANADAPIIEIVKAAGVQIRDLTLTRAEGKMETRHEGLQAMQCRDLVLENLRVLDNHSSRSAIGLHGCEGGQVRGCLVRNYHHIAVDDRTKSAQYGYAFHCIAGFGIETEHGSGVLIQANRVIEHRLLHESLMMHLTPPPRVPGTPRRGFTPNGAYLEGDPVFEAGVSGMASIQNMLLQSWGGKIRVFRAMPAE